MVYAVFIASKILKSKYLDSNELVKKRYSLRGKVFGIFLIIVPSKVFSKHSY